MYLANSLRNFNHTLQTLELTGGGTQAPLSSRMARSRLAATPVVTLPMLNSSC